MLGQRHCLNHSFRYSSDRYATVRVGNVPLLSSLRCNVPSSLLCWRYPAASHAAGQMASRCNLLSAVCGVFWKKDRGREKSSVKFSLHSACFPSSRADNYCQSALERTIFPRQRSVDRCADRPTDSFLLVPVATGATPGDALLVMEIEFCAENPQGQVTGGIFNALFRKFHRYIWLHY